jgi:CheY-like chemotaxis protein
MDPTMFKAAEESDFADSRSSHASHSPMKTRPMQVLLVEDSEGDIELVRQGFMESRCATELHVVRDGLEALAFLKQEETYGTASRPDLVLLDVNLPRRSGHEILASIRKHADLCLMPVVMFTTSSHERDIHQAYENGASAYVQKPLQADAFIAAILGIAEFWLATAVLPTKAHPVR